MANEITPFKDSLERHRIQLEKFKPEFTKVLPPHVTPDRLVRTVINALSQNEYLCKSASPASVLQAAMTAAVLGLEVDNVMGQGYIVPFKGSAQFIPGYKGYITLASNAGYLVSGDVVREKDEFKYWRGLNPDLQHTPAKGGPTERGPIIFAYATARSKALPSEFSVMHIEEINKIRDSSEGYKAFLRGTIKTNPWDTHYEAMAIKTAIRALASTLPLNVQRAAAIESAYERGEAMHLSHEGIITNQNPDQGKTEGQPNLLKNLGIEKDECKTCEGNGYVEDENSKGPCPDCG
jgi:recombination protein RecT